MSGTWQVLASTVSAAGAIWLTNNLYNFYAADSQKSADVGVEKCFKIAESQLPLDANPEHESNLKVSIALNDDQFYVSEKENNLCTVQPGNIKILIPDESEIQVFDIVKCIIQEDKSKKLLLEVETFDNARITFWNNEDNTGIIKDNIFFNIENVIDVQPNVNRFVSCRYCKTLKPLEFRAITVKKPIASKFNSNKSKQEKIMYCSKNGGAAIPARLQQYLIPEELEEILEKPTISEIVNGIYYKYPFMTSLKEKNYADFLHNVLYMEEIDHTNTFKKCSISTYIKKEDEKFYIHYPSDVISQTITVGNRVKIIFETESENRLAIAKIISLTATSLELSVTSAFAEIFHEDMKYGIEFLLNRVTYRKLHRAVDKMASSLYLPRLFPRVLTPDMYIGVGNINWINKSLNDCQKDAIRNILRLNINSHPYIIFGPPGTGKTVTITELILQIYNTDPSSRVLVAVPTNSSASVLTQYLIDSVNHNDIIRLTSFHAFSNHSLPEKIKHVCFLAQEEESDLPWIPFDKIGKHRITIGTFQTVGNLNAMPFSLGHFTHVIIDEAGQAAEYESLLPLILMDESTKIILSGDPYQLGPFSNSYICKKNKFIQSLALRLMENKLYEKDLNEYPNTYGYDNRLITKLVINYRSLPKIVAVTSKIFYDNELQSGPNVSDAKLKAIKINNVDLGLDMISNLFINVNGNEEQTTGDMSYFNIKEAEQVSLLVSNLYESGLEPDNIGIITPYRLQIVKINEALEKLNLEAPKVASVEQYQGDEKDVIIISLVRTNLRNISTVNNFIAQTERVNVALSRAKILNIVLGKRVAIFANTLWRNILGNYTLI